MSEYHRPVMLEEALQALRINPEGTYVDATFGGGGHARKILERLHSGRLIAFDQDPDAKNNLPDNDRLVFVEHNFKHLIRFLKLHRALPVDGILADLGVSSHQIDTGSRGFSTRFDAPLDMRMDPNAPVSARDVVNEYPEEDLADVFYQYGGLRNSRALARAVVKARRARHIETTGRLAEILTPFGGQRPAKFLAKAFQAIRIEVNQELEALKELLRQTTEALKPGGRLVVISYHSLEDRLVKSYIRYGNFEGKPETDLYGNLRAPFRPVVRKAIKASEQEISENPRARSARLRVGEKIGAE